MYILQLVYYKYRITGNFRRVQIFTDFGVGWLPGKYNQWASCKKVSCILELRSIDHEGMKIKTTQIYSEGQIAKKYKYILKDYRQFRENLHPQNKNIPLCGIKKVVCVVAQRSTVTVPVYYYFYFYILTKPWQQTIAISLDWYQDRCGPGMRHWQWVWSRDR